MATILRINPRKPVQQMPGLSAPARTIGPRYGVVTPPRVTNPVIARGAGVPVAKPVAAAAAKGAAVKAADPNLALTNLINAYRGQLLTPAQQSAQAKAAVDTQINEALAGIRASTAAEQQQFNQQATRAQGFAEAINSLRNQDAAAI